MYLDHRTYGKADCCFSFRLVERRRRRPVCVCRYRRLNRFIGRMREGGKEGGRSKESGLRRGGKGGEDIERGSGRKKVWNSTDIEQKELKHSSRHLDADFALYKSILFSVILWSNPAPLWIHESPPPPLDLRPLLVASLLSSPLPVPPVCCVSCHGDYPFSAPRFLWGLCRGEEEVASSSEGIMMFVSFLSLSLSLGRGSMLKIDGNYFPPHAV